MMNVLISVITPFPVVKVFGYQGLDEVVHVHTIMPLYPHLIQIQFPEVL